MSTAQPVREWRGEEKKSHSQNVYYKLGKVSFFLWLMLNIFICKNSLSLLFWFLFLHLFFGHFLYPPRPCALISNTLYIIIKMSHSIIKHQTIKTGILHYIIYMYTECFNCFYFPFRFEVSLQCDAVTFLYI